MERLTKQRKVINEVLAKAERPLSPLEILEQGRQSLKSLSCATVYRNINDMLREGVIAAVEIPAQSPRYEMKERHGHAHFVCKSCNHVFNLPEPRMEAENCVPPGFNMESREVILYGLCDTCH